jgi:hypothetical protein
MEKIRESKRLCERLNQYFKDDIQFTLNTQSKAFIATKDDKVFGFSNNKKFGIPFALSKEIPDIELNIVKELCGKKIVDLVSGDKHVIALTAFGKVYSWGENNWGQLGIETTDSNSNPKIIMNLENVTIVQVSCGCGHSLALTEKGLMFGWGWNNKQQACSDNNNIYQPNLIWLNEFHDEKVVSISCGFQHSMALTENNRVYMWGCNAWGQSGSRNEPVVRAPTIISDFDGIVEKISCGYRHSLLLTRDGIVYVLGGNSWIGSKNKFKNYNKIKCSEKFTHLSTHYSHNVSFAKTVSDEIYILKETEYRWRAEKTIFTTFNECFEFYFNITFEPLKEKFSFRDNFIQNGTYREQFSEQGEIARGSFGTVFKVKFKKNKSVCVVKRMNFKEENVKDIIKEFEIFSVIKKLDNRFVVRVINAWLENNYIDGNNRLSMFISMEFCEMSLEDVINEISKDTHYIFKKSDALTPVGYFFFNRIFSEILEAVNYLHNQNPPIKHRNRRKSCQNCRLWRNGYS